MTEAEELELLELEKEHAMNTQGPSDPYGRPIARAESIREPYTSEKFAKYAEPISQFGGILNKEGPMGAIVAGASTGAAEVARQGIQAFNSEPGQPQGSWPRRSWESLKNIGSAIGRGALGEGLGRGVFAAGGALASKALPTLQKTGAQVVRVATGVPEREALTVIKEPAILGRAPSVKEAGQTYEKALNSGDLGYKLKSTGEGSRIAFGKTMLSPEATINKFDELLPALESGKLDLQSALALRQTASSHLAKSKGEWFDQPMRDALNTADGYIEKRLLEFPAAKQAYREAKIGEEFGSWLPLNKNLSPNVLRTAGALGYAAHGAAEGRIGPMLIALGVSPKIWGYGIRAVAKTGTGIKEAAKFGTRLGTQKISQSILPSSTEELMRKHYEAQK